MGSPKQYFSILVVIIVALTQLTVCESRSDGKPFVILFWTKWFGETIDTSMDCSYIKDADNCVYTNDRNRINESDAVLFHWLDIKVNDLPKHHKSGQKWVLYNWKSPEYTPKELVEPIIHDIDWVMSYRKGSDIFVPYGQVYDCEREWNNEDVFDQKTKSISWLVSNCFTAGRREEYIKELSAYIKVDIYGKCGADCPHNESCNQMVYNSYKFYLSFENSLCKDYVTEKLYRTLKYDIIPIVYGPPDYKSMAPKNSYINARDFSSPKHLSEYLKDVSNNKSLYNSYLVWKRTQCVRKTEFLHFCDLCQKLKQMVSNSNETQNVTKKRDIFEWWFDQAQCIRGLPETIITTTVTTTHSKTIQLILWTVFALFVGVAINAFKHLNWGWGGAAQQQEQAPNQGAPPQDPEFDDEEVELVLLMAVPPVVPPPVVAPAPINLSEKLILVVIIILLLLLSLIIMYMVIFWLYLITSFLFFNNN